MQLASGLTLFTLSAPPSTAGKNVKCPLTKAVPFPGKKRNRGCHGSAEWTKSIRAIRVIRGSNLPLRAGNQDG